MISLSLSPSRHSPPLSKVPNRDEGYTWFTRHPRTESARRVLRYQSGTERSPSGTPPRTSAFSGFTGLADNPIAGIPASIPITKSGLDAITVSLANECAKRNSRFNAVAPGVVDTPLHKDDPKDLLKTPSPIGTISDAKDIADAVVYLTEAC